GTDRHERTAVERNFCDQIRSSVVSQRGERHAYQRESENVSPHGRFLPVRGFPTLGAGDLHAIFEPTPKLPILWICLSWEMQGAGLNYAEICTNAQLSRLAATCRMNCAKVCVAAVPATRSAGRLHLAPRRQEQARRAMDSEAGSPCVVSSDWGTAAL